MIVTPEIVTVGSLTAFASPTVSTGPPPLMMVDAAPAPCMWTLTRTVTPPAYVPGLMRMRSPSWAASNADCNVA